MNRILFLFVFFLLSLNAVFAEKCFSAAFAYNASWQDIENNRRSMYAPGIAFNTYMFFDSIPVGFWSNLSFHTTKKMEYNGRTINLDMGYPLHGNAGIVFNLNCTEKIRLLFITGLHASVYICVSTEEIISDISGDTEFSIEKHIPFLFSIGVCGNIALNIELTNWLFIDAGGMCAYDFLSHLDNYKNLILIPYIGLGIKT
jgi:hypothetical protein